MPTPAASSRATGLLLRRLAWRLTLVGLTCALLFSLTAVSIETDDEGRKFWLFSFIPASWQYLFQVAPVLLAALLAALLMGSLAGVILTIPPDPAPTKRGLSTLAGSAPGFFTGLGTAGFAAIVKYLTDKAQSFGLAATLNKEATEIIVLALTFVFFIIGFFLGIGYQSQLVPTSEPAEGSPAVPQPNRPDPAQEQPAGQGTPPAPADKPETPAQPTSGNPPENG